MQKNIEIDRAPATASLPFYQENWQRRSPTLPLTLSGLLTLEDLAAHQADWVDPDFNRLSRSHGLGNSAQRSEGIATLMALHIPRRV
jgi:gamma-glutamyltranspeptidase